MFFPLIGILLDLVVVSTTMTSCSDDEFVAGGGDTTTRGCERLLCNAGSTVGRELPTD